MFHRSSNASVVESHVSLNSTTQIQGEANENRQVTSFNDERILRIVEEAQKLTGEDFALVMNYAEREARRMLLIPKLFFLKSQKSV